MTQGDVFSNKNGFSNFSASAAFQLKAHEVNPRNKLMHTVKEVYGIQDHTKRGNLFDQTAFFTKTGNSFINFSSGQKPPHRLHAMEDSTLFNSRLQKNLSLSKSNNQREKISRSHRPATNAKPSQNQSINLQNTLTSIENSIIKSPVSQQKIGKALFIRKESQSEA